MPPKLFEKLCANKVYRNAAIIYGVILFNVGAVILYEKIGAAGFTFDTTVIWGGGCLVIGLAVFLGACACRRRP